MDDTKVRKILESEARQRIRSKIKLEKSLLHTIKPTG